jgi:hypothetical protein
MAESGKLIRKIALGLPETPEKSHVERLDFPESS